MLRGEKPNEVEQAYMENAQMLAQYGLHMFPAKVSTDLYVYIETFISPTN